MPLFSDINTWAVICLLAGLVLMVVEIFTPGFGLAGGSGLVLMAAAIILQAKSILEALILTAIILVILGIAFAIAVRSAQRGRLANSPIILKDAITGQEPQKGSLLGKTGRTVTPLRPAGTAEIEGNPISVITQGGWLDADVEVTVVGTDGVTPVVRRAQEPEQQ